jgi:hypothetical protein
MSQSSPSAPPPEQPASRRDDAIIGVAFRRSLCGLVVLIPIVVGGALLLNWETAEPTVQESVVELPEIRARPEADPPEARFTDMTRYAGLDFVHENGATGEKLLPETMGGGCALLDYDVDGDQDLLLVNSCRWPWDKADGESPRTMCLYRNDGDWKFTDVTAQAGLNVTFFGMGAAVGDYDNDGDPDVFFSCVGPNQLFRNDDGKFVRVTEEAGIAGGESTWSSSCGWFDYNNDGLLDLIVGNYVRWSKSIDQAQDFRLVGVGRAYGPPMSFEGEFPYLYRNEGNGRFSDVSSRAGVRVVNPITGVPAAKTLGIALADLDADGWIDIVMANDTVQNFLLHNQRDGTFAEIGALSGVAFDNAGNARGAMGIDTAFFRNDDTMAVAIGNFANEMTALYVAQDEPMSFVDAAIATGLGPKTRLQLTFGLFFFDYDLDGRLDLLAANGHLEEEINKVQVSQHYAQSPQLFWNGGIGKASEFVPVPAEKCGSDLLDPMVGRGAAFGDLDQDGDLDVLLTAVGDRPRLLRNDQQLGHHWLRFQLADEVANRDAIGAWVEVQANGQRQRRQIMPTRSYLSQCELPATFGLGVEPHVDKILVRWPDGETLELTDFQLDATNQIRRAAGE